MSTYHFKYHDTWQIEESSPEQLQRLEWIDRLLDDPSVEHDPAHLESLSDDALRELVSILPGQHKRAVVSVEPAAPVIDARAVVRAKVRRFAYPVAPRYKAQLWHSGKNESLGWFLTEQVRDEAVTMAKAMRDLGLPLDAIRAQVWRMK